MKPAEPARPNAVAIVAAGVISPLGRGLDATARGLREGRDCVTPVTAFDVASARCHDAGQIPDAWIEEFRDSRKRRRIHRASLMMIAAIRELLGQDPEFAPEQMLVGATGGGMTFGEAFYRSLEASGADRRHAGWLANYNPQKPVLDVQEAAGFRVSMRYHRQRVRLGVERHRPCFRIDPGWAPHGDSLRRLRLRFGIGVPRVRLPSGFDAGKDPAV